MNAAAILRSVCQDNSRHQQDLAEALKVQDNHNATIWSLDDYFLKQGKLSSSPLLFKIDCEGCESGALMGSFKILEQFPPQYIMIKIFHNIQKSLLQTLQDRFGYSRIFVIGYEDQWVRSDEMESVEPQVLWLGDRGWSLDQPLCHICDLLLVHDKAVDYGFYLMCCPRQTEPFCTPWHLKLPSVRQYKSQLQVMSTC